MKVRYRPASVQDEPYLRALLRENSMEGWVRLGLEREPDFFRGEGLLGDGRVLLAEEDDENPQVVGFCTCTWMPVHVNGQVGTVPYLGGLRVRSAFRNRPRLLRQGFKALEEIAGFSAGTPMAFTSLASDNLRARRILEAGLPGFPEYRILGELDTWVLPTGGRSTGRLVAAKPGDIPELVGFMNEEGRRSNLTPLITEEWLAGEPAGLYIQDILLRREGGRVRACVALWDQRPCKQLRIHGYRFPLNHLRVPCNLLAGLLGGVHLPAPGTQLESCFLAFFRFQGDDWDEAALDLQDALARMATRGARVALLGLPTGHPLGPKLRRGRIPWVYRTCIEAVRWPEAPPFPLDQRPIHPEIALL